MTTYIPSLTLPSIFFSNTPLALLLPNALGISVGFAVMSTSKTYVELKRPPLSPPGWVFGPVWTTLYALMGFSAWRAYRTGMTPLALPATNALTLHGCTLYTIQLVLNHLWTPLFFGFRLPVLASVDIVLMVASTAYLIYVWGQVDKLAAWALVPYLAWISFATYVCIAMGVVNDWDLTTGKAKGE